MLWYNRSWEQGRVIETVNLIKAQYINGLNTMAKLLRIMNIQLENERQECKTGPVRRRVLGEEKWRG
jgi:hypothetical protein